MIAALVLGTVLGVTSGVVPGPFSALVVATALRRGFRATVTVATVPLLTEGVVMIATALVLARLPQEILRWTGVAGGAFVFYLAYRIFTRAAAEEDAARDEAEEDDDGGTVRRTAEALLLALLSPAPWVFWLLLGAPLLLSWWHQEKLAAVLYVTGFLGGLVGVHLLVAWIASRGHEKLRPHWRRRLTRAAGAALALAGGLVVWQSWSGNFHEMVQGQRTLQELVRSLPIVGDS